MSTTNVNGGKNWWLWAVVIVLLLAGLWWAFGPYGKAKNSSSNKDGATTEVTADNTNSSGGLTAKDYEIASLKEKLAQREGQLDQANMTIAQLIADCGGKKSTTYSRPAPAAPKNTGGSGNTGGVPITRQAAPVQPESEYVVGGMKMPKTKLSIEKGEVKSCWQFGPGVWYPFIAVRENNEQFPNSVDNKVGGLDLWFVPYGTIGSTGASCGITEDGTHWLRVSEAQKYQAWITFDTPRPIIDGAFKNSTLTEINGEQFFVAK